MKRALGAFMPNGLPSVSNIASRTGPFKADEILLACWHVATASYRLLPSIHFLKPIPRSIADKFVSCFPAGVCRKKEHSTDGNHVEILDMRKDTVTREVLRHEEFQDKVALGRKRDHFICK